MQDDLAMTATMTDYMRSLEEQVERIYELARLARKKGIDSKQKPEILLTKDLAARVEGVIGPSGVSALIRQLAIEMSREEIAFKVAEEIVNGRFGSLDAQQAAEQAIRTGLAILTEGKTAAPLEGIGQVKVKQNRDGTAYLAIYFAGPIRAAGGTETALTVVLGDFVRRLLHLAHYKPTDEEVERYVEEIPLYARVCHLQVPTSPEEIRKAAQNLPVEITGESTETAEVSGYRDLERVETNRLRGGMALVLNDGVIGRAHKILALLDKIGLEQWDWLRELKQTRGQKMRKGGGEIALQPKSQYLRDVIAGRPIFSHPSRRGGFRVRYGRSRNTGLAAVGLHPATMVLLSEFLAIGTQMLTEKPGKGAIVSAVDSIEGPLVKLKNGDVLRIDSLELAVKIRNDVEEILFLGDILIGFGEFLENNHWLVPAGYCPEWWIQELRRGIRTYCRSSLQVAANQTGIAKEKLEILLTNYFWTYPTELEAIQLARSLNIPLHPSYTYFWEDLTNEEFFTLQKWLGTPACKKDEQNGFLRKITANISPEEKIILEKLGIPHKMKKNQIEIIEGAVTLGVLLDLFSDTSENNMHQQLEELTQDLSVLNLVTNLSGITLREKSGTQIGGRMGRPEKSRERKMRPPVHGLFPIELSGGASRNIYAALKQRKCILLEIVVRVCLICKYKTHLPTCPNCKEPTIPVKRCQKCGRPPASTEDTSCPSCGGNIISFERRDVDVAALLRGVREKIPQLPPLIKGVKKLINPTKEPEALEKVVLRAIHNVFVYKDGTIRYDATDAPLTHFFPNEIGLDVKTIKALGYTHDIYGNLITTEDQCVELKPQDIIICERSEDYLLRVTRFVDDLLQRVYNLPPFYNTQSKRDLIGHLVIGLAPHTSCGIIGRIIGFTKAQVHFAHPYWHAAKRRNCDGDEDAIILLLDGLLNFSRVYLPTTRGGMMDTPLILSTLLDPKEVDSEAHNLDVGAFYPLEFYEQTLQMVHPETVLKLLDVVEHRLGTDSQYEGFRFTHPTSQIDAGPVESAYVRFETMEEKVDAQLLVAKKVQAADLEDTAQRVINQHLLRDLIGCLRAYGAQQFRCVSCNKKYRRVPLSGMKCSRCGGKIILTLSEGSVTKYFELATKLLDKYNLPDYLRIRLELLGLNIEQLFGTKREKHMDLGKFL